MKKTITIKVLKRHKEWVVEFSYGVQFFTLQYGGTKAEAEWMAKMLRKCFKSYAIDILSAE
jgi:hypothetical protein